MKFKLNYFLSLISISAVSLHLSAQKIPEKNLSLNDVSHLMPLPQSLEENNLLKIKDFITTEVLNQYPRLSMRYSQKDLLKTMSAVSLRIDPFNKQLRAVWQPLMIGENKTITTLDVAFHTFHQLNDAELKTFIEELSNWKSQYQQNISIHNLLSFNETPLQVHPYYSESFNSKSPLYARHLQARLNLQQVFSKYLRKNNLVKMTEMVLRGNDDMWAFTGFEILNSETGEVKNLQIARTPKQPAQSYVNSDVPHTGFDSAQMSGPSEATPDQLISFVAQAQNKSQLTEDMIISTLVTTNKIDNPEIFTEEQMDCVHCHISQSVNNFISTNFNSLFEANKNQNQYSNTNYNLSNMSDESLNTRRIRGFGYFGSSKAISNRVIFDSAHAADRVNSFLK